MSVFRSIIPDSERQPANERYEHFMLWMSPSAPSRQWLFSHTNGSEDTEVDGFVLENETDIRSIPVNKRISYNCTTRFLTSKEFDYVRSIFDSNRVYKVLKSGVVIPVAVEQDRTTRGNKIKGFEVSMSFSLREEKTLSL